MKNTTIVTPSFLIEEALPQYITETYTQFVKFMSFADESQERLGFSQDLLQNLQRYRDFTTYTSRIVRQSTLTVNISPESEELILQSGKGFPEENGVILIDKEVIFYTKREGNVLKNLLRGASATVILPTFTTKGEYIDGNVYPAVSHSIGSRVENISVLFLVGFLETIYKSYAPEINYERVVPELNNATFLENISDFFRSKGSRLGIKALFKILFAENDVDVTYPGDRMIVPSKSSWSEALILRTTPQPKNLVDPNLNYILPDKVMNSLVTLRSYNDDKIYGESFCDYVSSYPYEDIIQYQMYLDKDTVMTDFFANPETKLTRHTNNVPGSLTDDSTITVESTLGFPDSGFIFINLEGIYYESKTPNQFLNCKRGAKGIEQIHAIGDRVYGPYYIQADITIDTNPNDPFLIETPFTSVSYPLGLVNSVEIIDGGVLHTVKDDVFVDGPGRDDPREPALSAFIENYDEQLIRQATSGPDTIPFIGNYTTGINSIYFDAEYVFISSNGYPYYQIGPFSESYQRDNTVGPDLVLQPKFFSIPRLLRENPVQADKGSAEIGVAVDGVPFFSEKSPLRVTQGFIKDFVILERGSGYQNPTVVLDPPLSVANAVVTNGQITAINYINQGNYDGDPSVRITSGENASFELTFDLYGRVVGATIVDRGRFYTDIPSLSVVDPTARGSGATLSCTVKDGEIDTVTVVSSGIDYNSLATFVKTTPIGSGAVVAALVEDYSFNRYQSVVNIPNWSFDIGNGFLWGSSFDGLNSTYGYCIDPIALRSELGDDGTKHSPILGYAFDGNPIYGPYGWTNGKNDSGGVRRQSSGYSLRESRLSYTNTPSLGSNPPAAGPFDPVNEVYPMGSFVEDFIYQPEEVSGALILTENGDQLQTNQSLDLLTDPGAVTENVLDPNNGKFCNTPEYPEEFYPNGKYCYFITIDENGLPAFPYIVGKAFENLPLSQKFSTDTTIQSSDSLSTIYYDPIDVNETEITFNLDNVERYRNPYLQSTRKEIELSISDVSTGSISSIIVEEGLPDTSKIDDIIYYEDPQDGQGQGAEGRVQYLTGEDVVSATGSLVQTQLRSHHQIIDFSVFKDDPLKTFVFVEGTLIEQSSGAIGRVIFWDTAKYLLEVQCETYYLFKYSKPAPAEPFYIYDNRGTAIETPVKPSEVFAHLRHKGLIEAVDENRVYVTPGIPSSGIGGVDPQPGDIAWSTDNGRMYIYYDDGTLSQWVESQPVGTITLGDYASNVGVGATTDVPQDVLNAGDDNTVTISSNAPSQRQDGTPNRTGDLWWSQETGILSIWYNTIFVDFETSREQWVMTEPSATVPGIGAVDNLYPDLPDAVNRGAIYTRNIKVIISETAPAAHNDGSQIEVGDLWWSSANGKMYIYYRDTEGTATENVQWVQCNPVGSLTSQFAEDDPINPIPPDPNPPDPNPPVPDPDDPYPGGDITTIPETKEQRLLWWDDTTNFLPGDEVKFQKGLGTDDLTEIARIDSLGKPDDANGIFTRGLNNNPLTLPDNTIMTNDSRAIYTVNTSQPHKLIPGDEVYFENSLYDEINGAHLVSRAGIVQPGSVSVTVTNGRVTDLQIIDPGARYSNNFFITFTGGGGFGALGQAIVSPIELGGGISSVSIITQGVGYIDVPFAILGTELTETQFQIYTQNYYLDDSDNLKYSARGEAIENTIAYVYVKSTGQGYQTMPPILGVAKRESSAAVVKINEGKIEVEGLPITDIELINGGSRYVNPTCIFTDRIGNGTGASAIATVTNGIITEIEITSSGNDYIDPVLTFVDEQGKFISLTRDIGKITASSVINPGRDISIDRSLRPELQITTNCIISYTDRSRGFFTPGSPVYQGMSDYKLVTAIVVEYDDKIQQLTLEKVEGVLRAGEMIYDNNGISANVLLQGEADCRVKVLGVSQPEGKFVDQTSMLSTKYAVIQDSKKYQYFSYEIASPIRRADYENFVNDIIHPAGFIMYSTVELNNSVSTPQFTNEPVFLPSAFDPDRFEDDILYLNGEEGEAVGAEGYGIDIALAVD